MKWSRATILVMAVAALRIASPVPARAAGAAVTLPDLRGQWRLDHARSDDVEKKMQEAIANARPGSMGGGPPDGGPGGGFGGPGGGQRGGPGGGMPPGGMPGGDMPDGDMPGGADGDGGPNSANSTLKNVRAPRTLESFTLEQSGDTLAFVDHGLRVRLVIVNNGRALPAVTADGVEQASGRWKKSRLVAESRGQRGEKNSETWELLSDGQTLRCLSTVRLPGAMGSIELNRIYARAAVARPSDAPPAEGAKPR